MKLALIALHGITDFKLRVQGLPLVSTFIFRPVFVDFLFFFYLLLVSSLYLFFFDFSNFSVFKAAYIHKVSLSMHFQTYTN